MSKMSLVKLAEELRPLSFDDKTDFVNSSLCQLQQHLLARDNEYCKIYFVLYSFVTSAVVQLHHRSISYFFLTFSVDLHVDNFLSNKLQASTVYTSQ